MRCLALIQCTALPPLTSTTQEKEDLLADFENAMAASDALGKERKGLQKRLKRAEVRSRRASDFS